MSQKGDSSKAHQRSFFKPPTIKPTKTPKTKTRLPEHQPNFFGNQTELQALNVILMLNVAALQ